MDGEKFVWGFSGKSATRADILGCVGGGWSGIVNSLINALVKLGWNGTVMQVKEKFGGLRFYIGTGNDAIWKRIAQAEHESYLTCEWCGEPGEPDGPGWILTLCEVCKAKRERLYAESRENQ